MKIQRISPPDEHSFFSYYDLPAWNAAGNRHLAHRVGFMNRMPRSGDVAEIGYLQEATQCFHKIGETSDTAGYRGIYQAGIESRKFLRSASQRTDSNSNTLPHRLDQQIPIHQQQITFFNQKGSQITPQLLEINLLDSLD